MLVDSIVNKDFEIKPRQSFQHPAVYLTDTDFADDLALISESLVNAQSLLQSLEQASNCVDLYLNESKRDNVSNCRSDSDFIIHTLKNTLLKVVSDYVYLGSCTSLSEKLFLTRKGNDLVSMQCSAQYIDLQLEYRFQLIIFKAAIEPILLYDSET